MRGRSGWATGLLVLSVIAGAGLAASGLGVAPRPALLPGAIAVVDGVPIPIGAYERLLGGREATEDDKRRLVERLVAEEILVRRALDLDLVRSDPRLRASLRSAVIDTVLADAHGEEPTDEELRRFYEENAPLFAGPGRFRIRGLFFRSPTEPDSPAALPRALEAMRRLRANGAFAEIASSFADPLPEALPEEPIDAGTLRRILGAGAVTTAARLPVGSVSDPIRAPGGYAILVLDDREPGPVPALDEIREVVLATWRERSGEEAVRRYVESLRESAEVVVREPLP